MLADLVRILVALGLPAVMLAQGSTVEGRQLLYLVQRPGLLARSLLAAVVAVPLIALLVGWLLRPEPTVRVGLAVLAACPVAPLMIIKVRKATGGADYVAALHLTLAVLSIVTTPLALALLSRALGFQAEIRPLAVAGQVARSVLLPFGLGVAARTWTPDFAARVRRPVAVIGGSALLVAIVILLAATWRLLLAMDLRSYLAMGVMLLAALAVGELLGGGSPTQRAALALESAARNPGLALLIATLNFDRRRSLAVLLPYLIVSVTLVSVYTRWRVRRLAAA
ncbi:MAG: bile acid:sodium symporter [Deltaproteobacteria bacterium]|nr:bile acid:sodium symporter [Deltaproteobacteria bacterium]